MRASFLVFLGVLLSFSMPQERCLGGRATVGPYDQDVTYTIWNTNAVGKRINDPIEEDIPLKKGASKTVWYNGSDSSVKTKTTTKTTSIDYFASTSVYQLADLDAVLTALIGSGQISTPSIFADTTGVALVGYLDVGVYISGGGDFSFDPDNTTVFNFVNGICSDLPGFYIAATTDTDANYDQYLTYVNGTGPEIISGTGATWYTGTAMAEGQVTLSAVPEPSTSLILLCLALINFSMRRVKCCWLWL